MRFHVKRKIIGEGVLIVKFLINENNNNNLILPNCKNYQQLMNWTIQNIQYKEQGKIIKSPYDVLCSGCGDCIEVSNLLYEELSDNLQYKVELYFCIETDGQGHNATTHAFNVIQDGSNFVWIECSWEKMLGKHEFQSIHQLFDCIGNNWDFTEHHNLLFYRGSVKYLCSLEEYVENIVYVDSPIYLYNDVVRLSEDYKDDVYIHYGATEFKPELFKPVMNGSAFNKPKWDTGFWASPVNGYGWKQWNDSEHFATCDADNSFTFKLKPNSKVYVIDSNEAVENLLKHYPRPNPYAKDNTIFSTDYYMNHLIDFEKLSKDYDALLLYIKYGGRIFWGWDVDSLLIFNPDCIENISLEALVEKLLQPKKNERRKKYISRFMSNDKVKKEFPDIKQRFAVCMSYWDRRNNKK